MHVQNYSYDSTSHCSRKILRVLNMDMIKTMAKLRLKWQYRNLFVQEGELPRMVVDGLEFLRYIFSLLLRSLQTRIK